MMLAPKVVSLTQVFWLLDYDGSLCPHREEWEFGHYEPGELSQILDGLAERSAGLVWNTGRSVESLKSQSPHFLRHPGFFEHGCYFWNGREQESLMTTEMPARWINHAREWAASRADWVRMEHKPHSFRLVPVRGQDRAKLRAEFRKSDWHGSLIEAEETYASEGWRALEVMVRGANKSSAMFKLGKKFSAFADAVPIAVGDDIADAGIAREVLAKGGMFFLVGPHCGWIAQIPHRASQVRYFCSPQNLLDYLRVVIEKGEVFDLAPQATLSKPLRQR